MNCYVRPGGSGNDKLGCTDHLKVLNDDDVATITVTDNASVNEGGSMTFTVKHTGKDTDFTASR